MSTLIGNIGELVTNDPSSDDPLGIVKDAAVVIESGKIAWVGPTTSAPAADQRVNAAGGAVVPGFVDSHSHLVFAGDRAAEYRARMLGESYAAEGIRATVAATRAATDIQLRESVHRFVREMHEHGTTTIEIKSGYGLNVVHESRSLRIAREFTEETTFLGAHVLPVEFASDPDGYVREVTGPMLAEARHHAKWIDVFCETGAFDVEQAREILDAGRAAGLSGRLHASQLGPGPGIVLAAELGLHSVDHCTYTTDEDIDALSSSGTVATLLPGVEFSTRQPYPDARRLLDAGVAVALASDCNPGSSFTSSMPFCMALAVREMGMTPEEALRAATAVGAAALGRDDIGTLTVGRRADLVLLDAPSYLHLTYRPGVQLARRVWKSGIEVANMEREGQSP